MSNPDRIVILSKAFGGQWEQQFFNEIQAGFDNGYRIAQTNLREDASMRNFRGRIGRAVMYLEGKEPEAWKPAVVEVEIKTEEPVQPPISETPVIEKEDHTPKDLPIKEEVDDKDLSTGVAENAPLVKELTLTEKVDAIDDYKGLKAFAAENNIELPAKVYNPKAVKKAIKKALEA